VRLRVWSVCRSGDAGDSGCGLMICEQTRMQVRQEGRYKSMSNAALAIVRVSQRSVPGGFDFDSTQLVLRL
jgi:hypothetical protein